MPRPGWLSADNHDALVELVRRYYAGRLGGDAPGTGFRGAYFDEWSGRSPGDAVREPDRITEADLYAMEYLSVRVPASAGVEYIHRQAGELSRSLAQIPTNVDLRDMDGRLLDAVSELDNKLREPRGVSYVKAAKILAKKRPLITCVFDVNVKKAFGIGVGSYLMPLARMLQENPDAVEQLTQLRLDAGLPCSISETRVLDVIAWMIGNEGLFGV